MIKDIDENGDGKISFLEFKTLMIEIIMYKSDV
jgi:Ca2+-binding EF-hand superfamily protein